MPGLPLRYDRAMTQNLPANKAGNAMLWIGIAAALIGAFIAYRGYQSATISANLFAVMAPGVDIQPDWSQFYVGLVILIVGAVLLLAKWIIAAARR